VYCYCVSTCSVAAILLINILLLNGCEREFEVESHFIGHVHSINMITGYVIGDDGNGSADVTVLGAFIDW
jgi:hypothetical protein